MLILPFYVSPFYTCKKKARWNQIKLFRRTNNDCLRQKLLNHKQDHPRFPQKVILIRHQENGTTVL